MWLFLSFRSGLFVFADRADRAGINRALDGEFIGDGADGGLGLAVISKFENLRNGGDAEATTDAEILVNFYFFRHVFSSNMETLGL